MAQYELLLYSGAGDPLSFPVNGKGLTLGRSLETDIRLDHPAISRLHVRFWQTAEELNFEYAGSRKGIKINGSRATDGVLKDGDRIEVGEWMLVVKDLEKQSAGSRVPDALVVQHFKTVHASNRLAHKRDPRSSAAFNGAVQFSELVLDSRALCRHVLAIAMELVSARRGFIISFDEAGVIEVVYSLAREGCSEGPNLNGVVINHMSSVRSPMLKVDERPIPSDIVAERPSAMGVPLITDDRVIGMIYVDSGWFSADYDCHLLDDLKALGQIAVSYLGKAGFSNVTASV